MSDHVELRQMIDRHIADVVDAVAKHRRVTRTDVVHEVLKLWSEDREHEAMLITRLTRGKGNGAESNGKAAE
jgi:Arc/MetJ-type ribon-helix-helix transcriptional regulator